ncbi:hypothetical protein, partial [Rhodococcus ruber]|uniref:hypothetical protein n=1 Tax=Rhodococcus ruber TaxID=1830 RepID=UPI000A461A91
MRSVPAVGGTAVVVLSGGSAPPGRSVRRVRPLASCATHPCTGWDGAATVHKGRVPAARGCPRGGGAGR